MSDIHAPQGTWRLLRDGEVVCTLHYLRADQPFFISEVEPSPGWPSVKPYFDELSAVPRPDKDGLRTARALKRLRALQLVLEDMASGRVVDRYYLAIDDDLATLRISGS
ncbi:hypothetical protein [Streptomyces sp. NPDC090083]|uniref:hypothetical protein n=1 Tax=Streptomyces sp. NPDC090083 TaxID=3365941 RepID=UPI003827C71E